MKDSRDSLMHEIESLQSNIKDPSQLPELKETKMKSKFKNQARNSLYDKIQIRNTEEALNMTHTLMQS